MKVHMPLKSKAEERFTADQAVSSRKVTEFRGVIERVNHNLKVYCLLSSRTSTRAVANGTIRTAWRVAAALHNRFFTPLARNSPWSPAMLAAAAEDDVTVDERSEVSLHPIVDDDDEVSLHHRAASADDLQSGFQ